jgi:hypothetical protein
VPAAVWRLLCDADVCAELYRSSFGILTQKGGALPVEIALTGMF